MGPDDFTAIMQLLDDAEARTRATASGGHAEDALRLLTEARSRLQLLRDEALLLAVDATSQAEVARMLGVTREAVSQQVTHARRRLMRASDPDGGGS